MAIILFVLAEHGGPGIADVRFWCQGRLQDVDPGAPDDPESEELGFVNPETGTISVPGPGGAGMDNAAIGSVIGHELGHSLGVVGHHGEYLVEGAVTRDIMTQGTADGELKSGPDKITQCRALAAMSFCNWSICCPGFSANGYSDFGMLWDPGVSPPPSGPAEPRRYPGGTTPDPTSPRFDPSPWK
jgi:hypothetical protein